MEGLKNKHYTAQIRKFWMHKMLRISIFKPGESATHVDRNHQSFNIHLWTAKTEKTKTRDKTRRLSTVRSFAIPLFCRNVPIDRSWQFLSSRIEKFIRFRRNNARFETVVLITATTGNSFLLETELVLGRKFRVPGVDQLQVGRIVPSSVGNHLIDFLLRRLFLSSLIPLSS